jgi:hypothetical protein
MKRLLTILTILGSPMLINAAAPLPPEVKVGTAAITDYEFDSGRDGVPCPSCNGGVGNSRLVYADSAGNLWVGGVDPATGNLFPQDGKGTLVDTNVAGPTQVGNGPEWAFSQRGSEIVYTRWTDGLPRTNANLTLGFAHLDSGAWVSGPVSGSRYRQNPGATLDLNDPAPKVVYTNATRSALYWRDITASSNEHPIPLQYPAGAATPRRWVLGTGDLILTAPAAADASGVVYGQVFLFHPATSLLEQLTFDPVNKNEAFMWSAPEFGGDSVFFTIAGGTRIAVYRKYSGAEASPAWVLVNSIAMPVNTPYIGSAEYFVHNGRSWIFFWLSAEPSNASAASRIAMTGIDPARPSLRALTAVTNPSRSRRDPEYFITANGPYIYYTRYMKASPTGPVVNEGVFRVDTGLGPRVP